MTGRFGRMIASAARGFLVAVAVATPALLGATGAQAQGADRPSDEAVQRGVDAYLARVLKDPYSAMIRQSSAVWWGTLKSPSGWGRSVETWAVCYAVNAKNSYGAYVGERFYLFLVNSDGSVREALPSGSTISRFGAASEAAAATRECAYRPAPTRSERSQSPTEADAKGSAPL